MSTANGAGADEARRGRIISRLNPFKDTHESSGSTNPVSGPVQGRHGKGRGPGYDDTLRGSVAVTGKESGTAPEFDDQMFQDLAGKWAAAVAQEIRDAAEAAAASIRTATEEARKELSRHTESLLEKLEKDLADGRRELEAVAADSRTVLRAAAGEEARRINGLSNAATGTMASLAARMDNGFLEHSRAIEEHNRAIEEHGRILDAIRAQRVDADPGLTREDFLTHYRLGEQLKSLFTQRLPQLTNTRIRQERRTGAVADALYREAELVREMTLALFGPGGPDYEALAAVADDGGRLELSADETRLLARVRRDAAELIHAITATGHPVQFVFDLPPGTPAHPAAHDLWTNSVPGRPVAFVVTPEYRAADRRILPPAVATVERAVEGG